MQIRLFVSMFWSENIVREIRHKKKKREFIFYYYYQQIVIKQAQKEQILNLSSNSLRKKPVSLL